MHEIFISYRRVDTEDAAGHLFGDLGRGFGPDSVFMDQHPGRIPWGSKWADELQSALENCDVLIALIGPQWARCTRSDGRRRLDVEDDWVRREIAAALRRGILVVPVLLKGAQPPRDEDLPAELKSGALDLAGRQCNPVPISVANWDAAVGELVSELRKRPRLRALHDLATAQTGIRLVEEIIRRDPRVRDAVRDSRRTIESTNREIDALKRLKGIHDALHGIEAECLRPLDAPQVSPHQAALSFCAFRREIGAVRQLLAHRKDDAELPTLLTDDLPHELAEIERAFGEALATGRPPPQAAADLAQAVYGLRGLAGVTLVQLDTLLDGAAKRLRIDALLDLIRVVRAALPPGAAGDPELRPLLEAIDALTALRGEIDLRVREHGRLQSLDRKLRRVCSDERPAATLAGEPRALAADWAEIRGARNALQPPHTDELAVSLPGMVFFEEQLDAVVATGDRQASRDLLRAYFTDVGVAFKKVDEGLKAFCERLGRATAPLKTILDMFPLGA